MTIAFEDFTASVKRNGEPPENLPPALEALWWDGAGNFEKAHEICQSRHDRAAAWVHGYLHRKEGDLSNAGYWYGRAGKARHEGTVDEEWARIARSLLRDWAENADGA